MNTQTQNMMGVQVIEVALMMARMEIGCALNGD